MSSGFKEVQINTQERAVSTDINRLQKFRNADTAELFRYLMNVTGNDDQSSGVITEYALIEAPLRAEIIGGLLVKPAVGSLDVLIDPGVLFALSPDGGPDDSNYKFVHDPGITAGGVLALTPNSSGQTRVDVIEVSVSPVVVETDSRDIFDETTNLFTAQLVTKAVQNTVTTLGGASNARVRAGTPGGGFPGLQTGWLPLAVAVVPTGTTTNDTATFYDVRPLVSDRVRPPFNRDSTWPRIRGQIDGWYFPQVKGRCWVELGGRRLGGMIRNTAPGTSTDYLDQSLASSWSPGLTATSFTGGLYWMYLVCPFGLPRWARYTDATSGSRVPRNPSGLFVFSNVPCDDRGKASAAVPLPAAYGLGAVSDTNAVAVAAIPFAGGSLASTRDIGWAMEGEWVRWGFYPSTPSSPGNGEPNAVAGSTVYSGSGSNANASRDGFFFQWDVHLPRNAATVKMAYATTFFLQSGAPNDTWGLGTAISTLTISVAHNGQWWRPEWPTRREAAFVSGSGKIMCGFGESPVVRVPGFTSGITIYTEYSNAPVGGTGGLSSSSPLALLYAYRVANP